MNGHMSLMEAERCAYLGPKGEPCRAAAAWAVRPSDAVDDVVPACAPHVGLLLLEGRVNLVAPLARVAGACCCCVCLGFVPPGDCACGGDDPDGRCGHCPLDAPGVWP